MEIQGRFNQETGEIFSEYNSEIINFSRAHGGKWNGKAWVFPKERVQEIFKDFFGISEKIVKVILKVDDLEDDEIVRKKGYVICKRTSRDSRAFLSDDVEMLSGNFPESGGSRKNPRTEMSSDSSFSLYVREDFAKENGLKIIDEEIKVNPFINFTNEELIEEIKRRNIKIECA